MKITPILNINFKQPKQSINSLQFCSTPDSTTFQNQNIDTKVLIQRGILKEKEDIDSFFDSISNRIFKQDSKAKEFSSLLKEGIISLSSNCYDNLNNPQSAIGIILNPNKTTTQNIAKLEEYIKDGTGIGINFNNFKNPIYLIKETNSYFKFREETTKRKPAGIALLNYTHPKIIDFITLKDNEEYKNWCFDLSIILPNDFIEKVDSNSDIILDNKTTIKAKKLYETLLNSMLKKGEPGIIFSSNPNFLCDSCAASELKENETLTLGQINLSKIYNNKIDYEKLKNSCETLSQAMKNIDSNSRIGVLGYAELLEKMNLKYGSKEALDILENSLKIIQQIAHKNGLKTAISPTGTISRLLKTTPSIEPKNNNDLTYEDEINTLAIAQKYTDCSISKTIILKQNATVNEIDKIIRNCAKNNIKGICVYKPN